MKTLIGLILLSLVSPLASAKIEINGNGVFDIFQSSYVTRETKFPMVYSIGDQMFPENVRELVLGEKIKVKDFLNNPEVGGAEAFNNIWKTDALRAHSNQEQTIDPSRVKVIFLRAIGQEPQDPIPYAVLVCPLDPSVNGFFGTLGHSTLIPRFFMSVTKKIQLRDAHDCEMVEKSSVADFVIAVDNESLQKDHSIKFFTNNPDEGVGYVFGLHDLIDIQIALSLNQELTVNQHKYLTEKVLDWQLKRDASAATAIGLLKSLLADGLLTQTELDSNKEAVRYLNQLMMKKGAWLESFGTAKMK